MSKIVSMVRDIEKMPVSGMAYFSRRVGAAAAGGVVLDRVVPVPITDGQLTTGDLEPGPATVYITGQPNIRTKVFDIVIPPGAPTVQAQLWDLIAASVLIPDKTPPQLVIEAVQAYLTANPIEGAEPTQETVAPLISTSGVTRDAVDARARAVGDSRYAPVGSSAQIAGDLGGTAAAPAIFRTVQSGVRIARQFVGAGAPPATIAGAVPGDSYCDTVTGTVYDITDSGAGVAPVVATTTVPGGTVGQAYSHTFTATGTAPLTWAVTVGTLPAGLTLNSATGVLSGTPTAVASSTFTVAASNGSGTGTRSVTVAIVAAATVPGAPTNLVLSPGDGQITATHTAPASNGGSAITDYEWQTSTDQATWTTFTDGVSTSAGTVITGQANGIAKYARSRAINAVGAGAWSATAGPVTPALPSDVTPPTTPGTPVAVAGNGTVTLTFTPGTDANLAGHRVFSSADGYTTPVATGATSPITVTGLTNGTPSPTYQVAAYDVGGLQSAKSAASNSVTPTAPSGDPFTVYTSDQFTGGPVSTLVGRSTDALLGGTPRPYALSTAAAGLQIGSAGNLKRGSDTAPQVAYIDVGSTRQRFQFALKVVPNSGELRINFRANAAVGPTNWYQLRITTTAVTMYSVADTGTTQINLNLGTTRAVNDVFEVTADGNVLTLVKNGATIGSVTDTVAPSGTFVGISGQNGAQVWEIDDFIWKVAA